MSGNEAVEMAWDRWVEKREVYEYSLVWEAFSAGWSAAVEGSNED